MVRHGGSSAGSYLANPTSPIPSHCASVVSTSTVRVNPIHVCLQILIFIGETLLCLNWAIVTDILLVSEG